MEDSCLPLDSSQGVESLNVGVRDILSKLVHSYILNSASVDFQVERDSRKKLEAEKEKETRSDVERRDLKESVGHTPTVNATATAVRGSKERRPKDSREIKGMGNNQKERKNGGKDQYTEQNGSVGKRDRTMDIIHSLIDSHDGNGSYEFLSPSLSRPHSTKEYSKSSHLTPSESTPMQSSSSFTTSCSKHGGHVSFLSDDPSPSAQSQSQSQQSHSSIGTGDRNHISRYRRSQASGSRLKDRDRDRDKDCPDALYSSDDFVQHIKDRRRASIGS